MVLVICFFGAFGYWFLGDVRETPLTAVMLLLLWGGAAQFLSKPKASLGWLIVTAVSIRVLMCCTSPSLSDDVYRYIWEGKMVWEGGNPYVVSVLDVSQLDHIANQVNHPEVTSVYPPLALLLFSLCSMLLYDPLAIQIIASIADIAIVILLFRIFESRKQSTENAWLFALHPLAVVESSSSGHIESLAIVFLVAAIYTAKHLTIQRWFLFVGGGIKLLPWLLLPLTKNWRLSTILGVLLAFVVIVYPFADKEALQGLITYTKHWSFNGSIYALLEVILGSYARWLCMLFGACVCLMVWAKKFSLERGALWICGAFVLLSPTVHPWYVLWVWVPALICRIPAWNLLATMVPLSYVVLATIDPETGSWSPQLWPSVVIYSSFFLCLAWEFVNQIRYPGPWGSGRPLIK
jgi:hypothetical protein